jgi:hypothetical protein
MQRTPGQRDYGSSDSARLRSLASRGVPMPTPQPTPSADKHKARPTGGRAAPTPSHPRGTLTPA